MDLACGGRDRCGCGRDKSGADIRREGDPDTGSSHRAGRRASDHARSHGYASAHRNVTAGRHREASSFGHPRHDAEPYLHRYANRYRDAKQDSKRDPHAPAH